MPVAAKDGDRQRQNHLGDEHLDHEKVHEALDTALFVSALLTVHHDARLFSRVDNEAHDPLSVL